MRAIGDNCIIKLENSTSSSGIQIKTDGRGLVVSCPKYPELEGQEVLFDDRHRFPTHEDMIFVPTENLLGVFSKTKQTKLVKE